MKRAWHEEEWSSKTVISFILSRDLDEPHACQTYSWKQKLKCKVWRCMIESNSLLYDGWQPKDRKVSPFGTFSFFGWESIWRRSRISEPIEASISFHRFYGSRILSMWNTSTSPTSLSFSFHTLTSGKWFEMWKTWFIMTYSSCLYGESAKS